MRATAGGDPVGRLHAWGRKEVGKLVSRIKEDRPVQRTKVHTSGWELVGTEWKRKGKATVDNVDDVLQDVDDPVNLIRNEHLTDAAVDAAANWTEAELPPHFRVMLDSFDVRLATMQSHFDGRLNEISNQQPVIQTELSEIRRHLNDKFDRLFVAVGKRSEDLSTSKAPTAQ
ncbi:hypothetical protein V6N13_111125 [Hibiscus sabdariffa]